MFSPIEPLSWATAWQTWHVDIATATFTALLGIGYCWALVHAWRRHVEISATWVSCFFIGIGCWALASVSMIGAYAHVLFWVRAFQVVLLLLVAPFFFALGRPLTVVRSALRPDGQARFDRAISSTATRFLTHPLTTSIAMLAAPWLLYLTHWYTASLTHGSLDAVTRILLTSIGFAYFYARLQLDPVPRKYPQLISLFISVAETIGDGVLGLVLWQGPLIATAYYRALHRSWGPDPRTDQSIGAGILWILGDVLGLPFLLVLMRALSADDKAHAAQIDAELDRIDRSSTNSAGDAAAQDNAPSTLWWENDPQLNDRFKRR
ncbi:cytochrome c oxidase assembly protein [Mycobacteroides saopaulense]|uniref:Copper resistance protein CopD n=1 Tax=Mycobacteroides saopaulense TaxID=1578165 RepID=A0ABX3C1C9_9MYCO|nr:cytochrome c oxidase assembly protein [Mycobacteroides saopaulense]OHT82762.1 copper resistance protein CopD [Mycobacteroides saopaulense]OHU10305.1 copper resistance protein CopD [Mycobacteroides saopaulense]